jgi:EmrB/QacA subfamily drug resistance transporter
MTQATGPRQAKAVWTATTWVALALLAMALFIDVLDISIVNVALPTIKSDLHFTSSSLQWVLNAYAVTYGGFLLLGGRAGDILGRRRVFIAGMALFTVASLTSGLAQTDLMLIISRACQGVGGAIVAPMTLALLSDQFPEGRERDKAVAIWGSTGGLAGAAGVLLGGLLTQGPGWRWIFFVNVPIGIVIIALAPRFLNRGAPRGNQQHFDIPGAVSATAGLSAVIYGIVQAPDKGWASAAALIPLVAGVALILVFVFLEARSSKAPLVPLHVFRIGTVTGSNVVSFMLGASMFAMFYFLSLYMQLVLGWDPLRTGLSYLPLAAAIVIGSATSPALIRRVSAGGVLATGMGLTAIGMLIYTQISVDTGTAAVILPSALVGLGLGFCFVPVTIAAVSGVPFELQGVASGLINASRQIGGALGLAVVATLAIQVTTNKLAGAAPTHGAVSHALVDGYRVGFAVCAGLALIGAVCAITLLRPPRRRGAVGEIRADAVA